MENLVILAREQRRQNLAQGHLRKSRDLAQDLPSAEGRHHKVCSLLNDKVILLKGIPDLPVYEHSIALKQAQGCFRCLSNISYYS